MLDAAGAFAVVLATVRAGAHNDDAGIAHLACHARWNLLPCQRRSLIQTLALPDERVSLRPYR
ncbi:MAG: hypothetical protein DCC67_17215 [Planctomycetota bacterium]|nr:MAG: hypothetical protein DCC67_17215 [Planctomycetota bacterium]